MEPPVTPDQPEIALWRAVLYRAFLDAGVRETTVSFALRSRVRLETDAARKFLTTDTPGFRAICNAASVPARKVLAEGRRQARMGWPPRMQAEGVFA